MNGWQIQPLAIFTLNRFPTLCLNICCSDKPADRPYIKVACEPINLAQFVLQSSGASDYGHNVHAQSVHHHQRMEYIV